MRSALSAQDIEKQAAAWLARQDAAALTETEQASFDAWLAEDDRHLGAYMRLRAVWARLDRLGALRPATAEAVMARSSVWRHWRPAAAAAMVVVMLAGGGYYGFKRPAAPKTFDTAIGEVRRLDMEDGSVVEMNTNSEVNVAYSERSRDIWLAHGESNFTVAKNKSRPFIVHAGDTTVTAVGTAFTVDATRPDQLKVAVSEGTVMVRRGNREPTYVTAMQILTLPTVEQKEMTPQLAVATSDQVEKKLAWRKGMLIFSGESLSEAAAQFNRYNLRQISVTPRAAAAAARVGGVFQTRDVEGFAHATAASFGLSVSEDKNGNMLIDKSGGSGQK